MLTGASLMYNRTPIKIQSYKGEYEVRFSETVDPILGSFSEKSFLVIDSNVDRLYPDISRSYCNSDIFVIEPSEQSKSLEQCQKLMSKLVENGFKKGQKLIAVGGGVVQDIVAFVSSVLYRGVEWTFVPTTLLAQADSCVGSKTSINFQNVKNLLGSFHPPSRIYCCIEFLNTLDKEDIKSGIGEILHYYLISDHKSAQQMMKEYNNILQKPSLIREHIAKSLMIKKKMVEKDEFDQRERRVFNYGHTFGHALEAISEFDINHGQAVTMGMDIANFISFKAGNIKLNTYNSLCKTLEKNIPQFLLHSREDVDKYISFLMKDKKNIKPNMLTCILLFESPNESVPVKPEVCSIEIGRIGKMITEYFEDRNGQFCQK